MFFIGSTIFVLPDMVLKSSSSCVFRLSSVIAYPVLGLGYTILRQLFNAIFTVLLTRNLLFKSGSHFCSPADLKEKTVLGSIFCKRICPTPCSNRGTVPDGPGTRTRAFLSGVV